MFQDPASIVYFVSCLLSVILCVVATGSFIFLECPFFKAIKDKSCRSWRKRTRFSSLVVTRFVYITIVSASGLFEGPESPALCNLQAAMQIVAEGPSVLLLIAIAVLTFQIVVMGTHPRKWLRYRLHMIFASFAFGVLMLIICLATEQIAKSGTWCWVSSGSIALRLLCLYFWIVVAFVVILIVYPSILHTVRKQEQIHHQRLLLSSQWSVFARLWAYPIIFFGCYLPLTALRFAQFVDPKAGEDSAFPDVISPIAYFEGALAGLYFMWVERTPRYMLNVVLCRPDTTPMRSSSRNSAMNTVETPFETRLLPK